MTIPRLPFPRHVSPNIDVYAEGHPFRTDGPHEPGHMHEVSKCILPRVAQHGPKGSLLWPVVRTFRGPMSGHLWASGHT